jgi:phage FluMu gp28-like protein
MNTTPNLPILLPYQQKWIADKSSVKVIEKSRRIGISWAEAADSVLSAAAASGINTWYCGYNQEMALEFINDCAFWARAYQLAASAMEEIVLKDEERDILAYRIKFASGYRVTALSSRPSNLRGKQGRIVIDEAAFHEDLGELLKAAIALMMWGGQIAIISTHNGVDNPFNQLIGEIRAGRKTYSLHRVTLLDALEQGLYQRICLKLGQEWNAQAQAKWVQELIAFYGQDAEEELQCIPSKSNKVYLPSTLVERCMSEKSVVLRLSLPDSFVLQDESTRRRTIDNWIDAHLNPYLHAIPAGQKVFYGMDFARSGDLSAIAVLIEEANLHRRCPFAIELRNTPFTEQQQILFALVDRLRRYGSFRGGAHDARGSGQMLAELASDRYGANRIQLVMATDAWYLENFPKYKAALEDQTITLPLDSDILDDHRAVRIENGIPKIPASARYRGSDGGYRHGDSAIALVLALYAVNQSPPLMVMPSEGARSESRSNWEWYEQSHPSLARTAHEVTQLFGDRSAANIFTDW